MTEGAVINTRLEKAGEADECLVLEVGVAVSADGLLLLVADLSDSCTITDEDLQRVARLMQPIPREWQVRFGVVSSSDTSENSSKAVTVGDLVDGVVDLRAVFLPTERVRKARCSGSFLGPTLDGCLAAAKADELYDRVVVVVLTDGMLTDFDPITLPDRVTVLGIGPANMKVDGTRWHGILPYSRLLATQDPGVTALLRSLAGCSLYGPCTIGIPCGTYRLKPVHEARSTESTTRSERSQAWDFSLGKARLEFSRCVNPTYPVHVTIRGLDDTEVQLAVSVETITTAPQSAPQVPAATRTPVSLVTTTRALAASLTHAIEQAVSARHSWQLADGSLGIPLPPETRIVGVIDLQGRPQGDAIVIIIPDMSVDGSADDEVPVLISAVHRNALWELDSLAQAVPNGAFHSPEKLSLRYHKLDARWIFQAGTGAVETLPPRGCRQLAVDVTDRLGRKCKMFFSGPMRTAAEGPSSA